MINDVEILYNFQSIYVKQRINIVSYGSAEFQNVDYPFIFETAFYDNKVLQLMSAGASLERFGDKYLVFIK